MDLPDCSLPIVFLILASGILNTIIKYSYCLFLKPDIAKLFVVPASQMSGLIIFCVL